MIQASSSAFGQEHLFLILTLNKVLPCCFHYFPNIRRIIVALYTGNSIKCRFFLTVKCALFSKVCQKGTYGSIFIAYISEIC